MLLLKLLVDWRLLNVIGFSSSSLDMHSLSLLIEQLYLMLHPFNFLYEESSGLILKKLFNDYVFF